MLQTELTGMACLGVGVRPLARGFPHASAAPSTQPCSKELAGMACLGMGRHSEEYRPIHYTYSKRS